MRSEPYGGGVGGSGVGADVGMGIGAMQKPGK